MRTKSLIGIALLVGQIASAATPSPNIAYCGFSDEKIRALLDFERKQLSVIEIDSRGKLKQKLFNRVVIRKESSGEYHVSARKGHATLLSFDPHLPGPKNNSPIEQEYESSAYLEFNNVGSGGCDFIQRECTKQNIGGRCLISNVSALPDEGVCTTIDDSPDCEIPAQ